MAPDTAAAAPAHTECEVMASVDEDSLVIAELCGDEAWITMRLSDTTPVTEWA